SASAHVSIEYSIKGPTFGVVSACSTATHAIGLTYRMIREGLVDLGIAGAADMVNPSIDGASMAMQQALDDAALAPSDIDYVNAHGTATAVNDVNETRAIKRVFGNAANKLSISSTKSMHGHCLGAGGGIEAVAAIKAINDKFVPA